MRPEWSNCGNSNHTEVRVIVGVIIIWVVVVLVVRVVRRFVVVKITGIIVITIRRGVLWVTVSIVSVI